MTHDEIIDTFGAETVESIRIFNHEWADPEQLIDLGRTSNNIKMVVNKRIAEADFSIGIGSIVPHSEAGWLGGGKIA
jgi:nickel-dependent lactate racemase